MTEPTTEKAPVDRTDYEGLQLDTRARDESVKDRMNPLELESPQSPDHYHLDCSDEKAMLAQREAEEARKAGMAAAIQEAPSPMTSNEERYSSAGLEAVIEEPPRARVQRICGLRQIHFWISFCLILAIVVVVAIIGAVVAKSRHASSSTTPASPPSTPSPTSGGSSNTPLTGSDVVVGSPLELVSLSEGAGASISENAPSFRLYFQSINGGIKEMQDSGNEGSWKPAQPILTDAANNTGLAAITYLNSSVSQSSIFYIGTNGYIQEKRNYQTAPFWIQGIHAINNLNVPAFSNPPGNNSLDEPQNNWDGYRLAAAYSENFHAGPQARLFFHSQATNGSTFVREMIWYQNNDSWIYGQVLSDPSPYSHLAATVDEATQTLRLFYSAGNLTLQESWFNMSDPSETYYHGITFPNLLAHDDADIAVVATNGSTLVYYYAESDYSIREINLTGIPGTANYQTADGSNCNTCAFNPNSTAVVAQPALITDGKEPSLYQPIGASITMVTGQEPQIYVFWAEQTVAVDSGYGALKTVSRSVNSAWGQSSYGTGIGQVTLPLGNQ